MAADAITAAVDVAAVETITVSGLSAFFSYVEAAVTAAMHLALVDVAAMVAADAITAVAANSGCPQQ